MLKNDWPTEAWKIAEPSQVKMDEKKLSNLDDVLKSQYKNINAIIIVRKGHIVLEQYYNGYGHLDTHHVASVTKSFISALIGIAIDKGYIDNVDQKVLGFFPEYNASTDDFIKRSITIKDLLTMTAPFALKAGDKEPLDRLRRQRDWVVYALNHMGRGGMRGKFQYCTTGTHLLSAIITRATGLSSREFANKHLFKPTGMKEIPDHEMKSFTLDDVFGKYVTGWVKEPQGNTTGGWGLNITPRDMARFGLLYLNDGIWDNNQIISKEWIDASTAMTPNEYGYLWWLIEEGNVSGYTAAGSGGNHIFCIPNKDLVVIIASKIIPKPMERLPLLEKYIIPAILD